MWVLPLPPAFYIKKTAGASPKDIMTYTISQDYYFDALLANKNRKVNGEYPEFSTLNNTLVLKPLKFFTVSATLQYHHTMKQFTQMRFKVAYNNRKSPIYGDFMYSSYINPYAAADYKFNRDIVGGSLVFDTKKFPIKFRADVNYDITDGEFRAGSFKLTYDYQCINFRTELRLIRFQGRVETQFNFGVSFGNLGMVKGLLGLDKL